MTSVKKHALTESELQKISFTVIPANLPDSYTIALSLLKGKQHSAVFCMADVQAFGFYQAARELGISIPGNLSIVSCEDLPLTQTLVPGLTCIHQNQQEKGRIAAELLFRMIAGEACESLYLDASIRNRESVLTATTHT